MERTERIALLHGLLSRKRYGLSNDRLMREAECSRRDLSFKRDTLGTPLVPKVAMRGSQMATTRNVRGWFWKMRPAGPSPCRCSGC